MRVCSRSRLCSFVNPLGFEKVPDGIEGIATDIVARRVRVVVNKAIGIVSQTTASGGETAFESREITDAEWRKLRNAVSFLW